MNRYEGHPGPQIDLRKTPSGELLNFLGISSMPDTTSSTDLDICGNDLDDTTPLVRGGAEEGLDSSEGDGWFDVDESNAAKNLVEQSYPYFPAEFIREADERTLPRIERT